MKQIVILALAVSLAGFLGYTIGKQNRFASTAAEAAARRNSAPAVANPGIEERERALVRKESELAKREQAIAAMEQKILGDRLMVLLPRAALDMLNVASLDHGRLSANFVILAGLTPDRVEAANRVLTDHKRQLDAQRKSVTRVVANSPAEAVVEIGAVGSAGERIKSSLYAELSRALPPDAVELFMHTAKVSVVTTFDHFGAYNEQLTIKPGPTSGEFIVTHSSSDGEGRRLHLNTTMLPRQELERQVSSLGLSLEVLH
jgi:hypothetical protein